MKYGLKQFRKDFPTDQACLEFAFDVLHSRECSCGGVYKRIAHRNAYYCTKCRKQINPLAQTIFKRSLVPLRGWFRAMLLIREGMSIIALGKELGIGYKTAWRVAHILRKADAPTLKGKKLFLHLLRVGAVPVKAKRQIATVLTHTRSISSRVVPCSDVPSSFSL